MAYVTSTPATSTSRSTRSARRSGTAGASPSSTSPTRLSRVQEKDELRHLNDRLAAYIERVRQLENDKSTMLLLLEEKEESKSREMGNVRRLYEAELADARKTLDVLANERARLQIDFGHISEDHRTLQARNHKKETELNAAVIQLRNLEASLNSKDAQYANLLAENRRLENDTSDLQAQLVRLEESVADAKSQLNSEMLRRVDVENQVLTLREQLDFQLHMNEQEVKSLRTRHETRLVEVDSGRQKEFESKLSEAMHQLRQEHEGQIQQYKEELEKNFCSKSYVPQLYVRQAERLIRTVREPTAAQECVVGEEVEEVQNEQVQIRERTTKLENAKQNALKSSDVASSTREELAGTKLRIDNLSSQLTHFQKQNGVLEERVRELERTLDREREVWQHRLSQKDQEMSAMRGQMLSQLEDYENLLDVKLALDMEINAYRKMLEGEEQRLNLSPSPSQHGAVARTHVQATRKLRGKKRKHECGPSGSSPAYKVSQHATAHGDVTVAEIDLEGNYVKLKNNSETEQPLGGWVVRRTNPDSPDISFQIPSPYSLAAGQSLTIWASQAGVEPNPPSDLVLMSHRTWGPVNDIRVTLLNLNDEETAERKVLCVQGRVEEDSDVEFDEEYEAGSDVHHLRRQAREGAGEPNCAIM